MIKLLIFALALTAAVSSRAQYPAISSNIAAEAKAKQAAADQRSDEAFAKAMPVIKDWAAKGKPSLPGAAEPKDLPQANVPSFPGAWGGGMYSFGGRGGKVFIVTNLDDSGAGSFREACEAGGPRFVIFNVAGIIHLKDRIRIRAPYITIVGNTAPGGGVCLAGNTVELETHDVIIRYMRFRRGATDVGDRNDSLGGNPTGNIMIDHVSGSWGLDENMSMYRHRYQPPEGGKELKLPTVNITMQNCIFSEGLNTYHHAFGSTIGGLNSTFHHNLWACNTGRNPSVGMIGDFTFINNVVFNWVHRTVDGGDQRSYYTIENNYFKPGPATPRDKEISWRLLKPESERSKTVKDNFGIAYIHGNIVEGNAKVTADNWDGWVITEFLTPVRHAGIYNTISCAAGFHLAEGRWLRDQIFLDDYTKFWLRGNDGKPQPHFHKFSSWFESATCERFLVNGDKSFVTNLLTDFVADYRAWETERLTRNGLFWQYNVRDGMEESISGSRTNKNLRPTINSYMFANASAVASIAWLAGDEKTAKNSAASQSD